MAWNQLSTWNSIGAGGSAATISAVTSSNGADTATALGTLTLTVDDSTGVTAVTVNGVSCTSVATPTGTSVTCTCPKAFGDNYGVSADVVVNNGSASTGYAVTTYIPDGYTETDFTVNYAGLNTDSPFYGDVAYSSLVIGDSCVYESVTSPDSHSVSMSGNGVFTISGTITAQQTFDFYIFDDSDNTAGTDGTVTIEYVVNSTLSTGVFTLSGSDITALHNKVTVLESGAYTLTGSNITSSKVSANSSLADTGSFVLTGSGTSALINRVSALSPGTFTLTGSAINSSIGYVTILDSGSFTLTGSDVSELYNRVSVSESGSFTLTGSAISDSVNNGEQGGGVPPKKRKKLKLKQQEEYEKAYKSAKTRADVAQRLSKLKKQDLTKSNQHEELIELKASNVVIDKINNLESELDQEIAKELYLNKLRFKKREDELLAVLLLM